MESNFFSLPPLSSLRSLIYYTSPTDQAISIILSNTNEYTPPPWSLSIRNPIFLFLPPCIFCVTVTWATWWLGFQDAGPASWTRRSSRRPKMKLLRGVDGERNTPTSLTTTPQSNRLGVMMQILQDLLGPCLRCCYCQHGGFDLFFHGR